MTLIRAIAVVAMMIAVSAYAAGTDDAPEPDIKLYYLHYSPFIIEGDEKGPAGSAAPRLMELLEKSGLTWKFYYVPWTRAMQEIERSDDALIFPFTYSDARKNDYEYILPLYRSDIRLMTRRSDERSSLTRDEAASGELKSACYAGTVQCDIFRRLGFPEDNIIKVTGRIAFHSPRLVSRRRADFFVGDYSFAMYSAEQLGLPEDVFKPVEGYREARTDYLAAAKALRPALREKLLAAAKALAPLE